MARQRFEFYCTECKKYFDITMNMSLNGWFRIHCPNVSCGHIHYRKVNDGKITEDRFTEASWRNDEYIVEDIKAMPSSCRDHITEKAEPQTSEGFVKRLWEELFGARV